jgi:hypothetical protein
MVGARGTYTSSNFSYLVENKHIASALRFLASSWGTTRTDKVMRISCLMRGPSKDCGEVNSARTPTILQTLFRR